MFDFETTIGRGSGVIRLVPGQDGQWGAYAINFTLQELNEVPEIAYRNRPRGEHSTSTAETWYHKRVTEVSMPQGPEVLIIGAGKLPLILHGQHADPK